MAGGRAVVALLALTWAAAGAAAGHQERKNGAAATSGLSPITRVVELLKGLGEKIESEGKKESNLYETFICWARSVLSQKRESNAAAQSRVDMLTTYVADLDAGRIELTTERVDLEKEIEELSASMEAATEVREKENSDYDVAKKDMEMAIASLASAEEVLKAAGPNGVRDLSLAGLTGQGVRSRAAAKTGEAAALHYAAELGQKFLTKGDARFLKRLLNADVPTWNWKKLNRKATFKKTYQTRTAKIQEVLGKLFETFSANLREATQKETASQSLYDEIMASKGKQKDVAQAALKQMEEENGAKGMSRADATAEIDSLNTQVTDDTRFISETESALAVKKTEWETRKTLRAAEVAAVSKAIAVLQSDDARDNFKKSYASQGYLLQQTPSGAAHAQEPKITWRPSEHRRKQGRAAAVLHAASRASNDERLAALETKLSATRRRGKADEFQAVLASIDSMLGVLQEEETKDLETKESCETARAADTRESVLASRAIDDMSDKITALKATIAELEGEIKAKQTLMKEIEEQLTEATRIRDDEHAGYVVARKQDVDAAATVESAKEILSEFYASNNLMLASIKEGQPAVVAGQAPPPPPPTWEAPYGGKTTESTGIVAMLTMIHEDITKDIADADADETAAAKAYADTKADLTAQIQTLTEAITDMQITIGDKTTLVETTMTERSTKKSELDTVMIKIKGAEPGCDFFAIHFDVRKSNRQIEVDGLLKAKAILSGASFNAGPSPDRELVPGDAAASGASSLQVIRRRLYK